MPLHHIHYATVQLTVVAQVGGVRIVMKELLDCRLLNGDVMTCTGQTMAHNLATYPSLSELHQSVIQPIAAPFAAAGNHITVISGSLAPESALIKLSGKDIKMFEGSAQCFGESKQ